MDKIQLIKQEIKRLYNLYELANDYQRMGACSTILDFIDSIPEEPNKQPKFKVGDTIKGPCNNIFQVKEVLDTQYLLHSEHGDELNSIEIVDKHSCISEEPVSEDLEEEHDNYFKKHEMDIVLNPYTNCKDIASHFAEWQKSQMKESLQTEYEKGRFDMREEMMKDAVDATIFSELKGSDGSVFKAKSDRFRMNGAKISDRIKVIPIKTEQQ